MGIMMIFRIEKSYTIYASVEMERSNNSKPKMTHLILSLTLSIRYRPIRPFKQNTISVRNEQMSLRNFHPLSLSVINFTPAVRAFCVRVAHPDVFGEEESFLTIQTMPAVIVVFEGESEFPLSSIEELGRTRILRSLFFNGLRNQRAKALKERFENKKLIINAHAKAVIDCEKIQYASAKEVKMSSGQRKFKSP
ncbi:hypothetical protein AVEN_149380-1 [Araneus ventricosus]|uniref:Uncharacterized protein n=1 Tax=Araneus ventricosus TaxID=182803 RepID=A0A4Y2NPY5_ARAVE|nr:hypothetical protein AVEN_149380-1 [Araneus ventricosus]